METAEITDEPQVTPLTDQKIIEQRIAAAQTNQEQEQFRQEDPNLNKSSAFNDMAAKLEKAMKEVTPEVKQKEASTAPIDKQQTDSRKKLDEKKTDTAAAPEKEAVNPADDIENKTITSAKAADWKALKEVANAAKKERDDLKQKYELTAKEYEEFKKKAIDTSQLEPVVKERDALKTKAQQYEDQLKTIALERSPEFRDFYDKKFTEAVARAKDAAGSEAERIEQLMALPPTKWRKDQINTIRETLEGMDQGQLDIAISEYDKARLDRDAQLKDSKTNYERLQQIETDKATARKQMETKQAEAAMNGVLAFARGEFDSFKKGDDEQHNVFVAEAEQFVTKFFNNQLTRNEISLLPVLAKEAERYKSVVVPALLKENAELKAALKENQGTQPDLSGGPPSDPKGKPMGFTEAFLSNWTGGPK